MTKRGNLIFGDSAETFLKRFVLQEAFGPPLAMRPKTATPVPLRAEATVSAEVVESVDAAAEQVPPAQGALRDPPVRDDSQAGGVGS